MEEILDLNNTIVITQERLAGWLMFNKFHKISEKPDFKDVTRNIYIFKDTPLLREVMGKYSEFKSIIK
ncbi:hypothetical protein BBD42_01795 [Paenibacillus sp. BIHB 4019]|uniref:DUF5659 domain-containing protein n=1 Tax=Paenibacillus sp. BIHB 4019 TaxID=1870819 RepID=A0A1B2DCC0_9BACL|nr:hypothetical protein BBD42_01795 [Paenibacillus sp. BIHB 4019]